MLTEVKKEWCVLIRIKTISNGLRRISKCHPKFVRLIDAAQPGIEHQLEDTKSFIPNPDGVFFRFVP